MRTRIAAFVIACCACGAVVVPARQTAPQLNPLASDATAIASGQDLYNQTCLSCHGPAGQGSDRGPALATTALLHGSGDGDLFRSIRSGVPGTQMAGFPALSDMDTWRLVAYLHSLQSQSSSQVAVPVTGEPRAGESLFFGEAGCATCHEINGRGGNSWKGESWKTGGGGTWLTGTYDPELDTLYWPIGNPAAMTDRSVRGDGDNLFTDSVVALDPDTGQRKWHYQFTPNDGHDWDSTEDMVLVDRVWRGEPRKLLMHADRNGHFYVLDRRNGTFLAGTPFIHQTWNKGFDATGRPMPIAGSNSSPEGSFFVYPTAGGATNFGSPSYSPVTGLFYLEYSEAGALYISAPQVPQKGREYLGEGPPRPLPARGPSDPAPNAGVKALDPKSGETVWDFKLFQGSLANGVLATAGGILFASSRDGNLIALDAKTGTYLWHYQTGGNHAASPISYAIDGRQYIALTAGNVLYSFALPE